MNYHQIGLIAALVLIISFAYRLLHNRNKDAASKISLDDLLLGDDGKVSKAAIVLLGAFVMTTWVVIYLTLQDKLTEGYFGGYIAAWVAPTITKLFKGAPNAQPSSV